MGEGIVVWFNQKEQEDYAKDKEELQLQYSIREFCKMAFREEMTRRKQQHIKTKEATE